MIGYRVRAGAWDGFCCVKVEYLGQVFWFPKKRLDSDVELEHFWDYEDLGIAEEIKDHLGEGHRCIFSESFTEFAGGGDFHRPFCSRLVQI